RALDLSSVVLHFQQVLRFVVPTIEFELERLGVDLFCEHAEAHTRGIQRCWSRRVFKAERESSLTYGSRRQGKVILPLTGFAHRLFALLDDVHERSTWIEIGIDRNVAD